MSGRPAVVSVAVYLLLTTLILSIFRLGFSVPVFIQHGVAVNPGHLSRAGAESLLIAALIIVVTLYVGYCGVTVWACMFALKGRIWSRVVLTGTAVMSVGMPLDFLTQRASDQTFAALVANFLIAGLFVVGAMLLRVPRARDFARVGSASRKQSKGRALPVDLWTVTNP